MLNPHTTRRSFILPHLTALCLAASVCVAAPSAKHSNAAPSPHTKTALPAVAASSSSNPPSGNALGEQRAPLLIPAGLPGTWSGKQGNIDSPITDIMSAGDDLYALAGKTLLHSLDGGKEWHLQRLDFTGSFWRFSANDLWIAAGNKLAHSVDRGKNWTVTTPFPSGFGAYSLWGAAPSELYALGGSSGNLFYSKDGGKTFAKEPLGVKPGWLYQVLGNGNDVFVAGKEDQGSGSKAVLLVTQDHGKHWKRLTPPKAKRNFETVSHLCFSESGQMFITTSYDVYSSPNRGKTWKAILSTDNVEILALACRGKELYVGGRGRMFRHSRDEGATWTDDELAPLFTGKAMASVQAIHVTERGQVFAGGEGEYTDYSGSLFRLNP